MMRVRGALRRVAFAWLLYQAATLTLTPAVLAFGAAEESLECTCGHGEHAICPMHHKPAPGSKICLVRSANDGSAAIFSWLLNVGLMPTPAKAVAPEPQQISRPIEFSTASLRPEPPDPPPPRA